MRLIDADELLKAVDTWDKFGVDDTNSLFRLDNLSLPHYVPYIHYDDVIKCIKGMPTVQAVSIDVLQEIRQEIEQLKGTFPKEYYIKLIDKHIKEIEG